MDIATSESFLWKYQSLKFCQAGASGTVFQAKCIITNKTCALKVVKLKNKRDTDRFVLETTIAKTLSPCRHIVTTKDSHISNNSGVLVMELMRNDLLNSLQSFKSEKSIKTIFHQISQGLAYCHSLKIAHLDIKPENILTDSQGNAFLCDFGSAQSFSDPVDPIFGTSFYRAPETYKSTTFDKAAADIWSMGILLFVLFTGVYPYPGETEEEVIESIDEGALCLDELHLIECSPSARELIQQLLALDPAARPTIFTVIGHKFLQINDRS